MGHLGFLTKSRIDIQLHNCTKVVYTFNQDGEAEERAAQAKGGGD